MSEPIESRREFVYSAASACVAALILPGCGKTPSIKAQLERGAVVVPVATLKTRLGTRPGAWLDADGLAFPIVVIFHQGTWHAFDARCTHQACPVRPIQNGMLACTCHGSRFTLEGEVRGGPAPGPLTRYQTELVDGLLRVLL